MSFIEMPRSFEHYTPPNDDSLVITEILAEEQLQPISFDAGGKVTCQDNEGNKYFTKRCSGSEREFFTSVFPAIRQQEIPFTTLELPEFRNIVSRNNDFIFIKYYDGKKYNSAWDEISSDGYGRRGITADLAPRVVSVISDFAQVDLNRLAAFNLSNFDFNRWRQSNLPLLTETLTTRGIVNDIQIKRALKLLDDEDLFRYSKKVLTNGDFYPRNLIEFPGNKIVIID